MRTAAVPAASRRRSRGAGEDVCAAAGEDAGGPFMSRERRVNLLRTHIALMFVYSLATGIFFALLWRETRRERVRTFLIIFCSLFLGALAIGWAMYRLPR